MNDLTEKAFVIYARYTTAVVGECTDSIYVCLDEKTAIRAVDEFNQGRTPSQLANGSQYWYEETPILR